MITPGDVEQAVVELLRRQFPGKPVYQDLIHQDFARPSFLVEPGDWDMTPTGGGSVDLSLPVRIVCFEAVDDYYDSQLAALRGAQLQVMALFAVGYLRVGGRAPHVVKLVGGAGGRDFADVTVTLQWSDCWAALLPPVPPTPTMETINLRMEDTT